ncbi:N-acetyltransferase [Plantactinospora sp. KBS50]|uniref:N-acetyltransferase n=1 Tax=Plantactinospora sp. KBS50 TaxID=2024580 RepID=UPI000BAAD4EE|nr:N-acetyltransferase [Plantactinospora sp. KBS50]ASW53722.1 hypothetical protein CIK06_05220 [Plantactinospora sp. KBS50]
MRLVRLDDGADLEFVYRSLLVPTFPPSELISLDELREGVRDGGQEVWAAVDDDGRILATAVGEWSPSCRVMLLGYLAVAAQGRGGGTGGRLYDEVVADWAGRYRPCVVLAEVERPDRHDGSAATGDPAARLRFYGRRGARILDLPYFQPSLGGAGRVYGMLLMSLHVAPELAGAAGADTVATEPLRVFLTEYLTGAEGGVATDPATTALLGALDRPGGVPARPTDELAEVPCAEDPASA